jgi:putative endonuclease
VSIREGCRAVAAAPFDIAAKADHWSELANSASIPDCTEFVLVDAGGSNCEEQLGCCTGPTNAIARNMRRIERRFVYVLQSQSDPTRHYIGIASDPHQRLGWHNSGPCGYTVAYRPWSLIVAIEFRTEPEAVRFEKYLKSGSGRAFAKRHFGAG